MTVQTDCGIHMHHISKSIYLINGSNMLIKTDYPSKVNLEELTARLNDTNMNVLNNIRSLLPSIAFLLNSDACNSKCLYCYSSAKSHGKLMSWDVAKVVVDFIIKNTLIKKLAIKNNQKEIDVQINFMGGGEPTINWNIITKTVEYTKEQCAKRGLKHKFNIQTNAQCEYNGYENWLFDNIDSIGISLDGLAETQNFLRPRNDGRDSFFRPKELIRIGLLKNMSDKISVRSTVTECTYRNLESFCEWLILNKIKTLHLEPLTICGRALLHQIEPPLLEDFISFYLSLKNKMSVKGLNIYTSADFAPTIRYELCKGYQGESLFVTSNGDLTSCVEITNPDDLDSKRYFIGKVDNNKILFNDDATELKYNTHRATCKNCFLQSQCAICVVRNERESQNVYDTYSCNLKRKLAIDFFTNLIDAIPMGQYENYTILTETIVTGGFEHELITWKYPCHA